MRRRVPPESAPGYGVPARLLHYDPQDWPDPECHPECAYWAAVGAWQELHPEDDLFDGISTGPDEPFHWERFR